MGALSAMVGAACAQLDGLIGGQLTKALLVVDDEDCAIDGQGIEFQFNPEQIRMNRKQGPVKPNTTGIVWDVGVQTAVPAPARLQLDNVIFDTYEQKPRRSVHDDYIELLELMLDRDDTKGAPPRLAFHWGRFTNRRGGSRVITCRLDDLSVDYTMFLNDGTPVRAKAALTLRVGLDTKTAGLLRPVESPGDGAKLCIVKRGDSLTGIAATEYGNPGEWRRIADANGIDDPMSLTPGSSLLVPPIL